MARTGFNSFTKPFFQQISYFRGKNKAFAQVPVTLNLLRGVRNGADMIGVQIQDKRGRWKVRTLKADTCRAARRVSGRSPGNTAPELRIAAPLRLLSFCKCASRVYAINHDAYR